MRIVEIANGYAALANMYAVPFTTEAQKALEDCLDTELFSGVMKIWRWTP